MRLHMEDYNSLGMRLHIKDYSSLGTRLHIEDYSSLGMRLHIEDYSSLGMRLCIELTFAMTIVVFIYSSASWSHVGANLLQWPHLRKKHHIHEDGCYDMNTHVCRNV